MHLCIIYGGHIELNHLCSDLTCFLNLSKAFRTIYIFSMLGFFVCLNTYCKLYSKVWEAKKENKKISNFPQSPQINVWTKNKISTLIGIYFSLTLHDELVNFQYFCILLSLAICYEYDWALKQCTMGIE